MKTFSRRHKKLIDELAENLSCIQDTSDLLPHTVYVEEVGGNGVPEYFKYDLLEIYPDGRCALLDGNGIRTEEYNLNQVCVDWLLIVWNRHVELIGDNEDWREDAIAILEAKTDASLEDILDFCESYWENLLPYAKNLKAFRKFLKELDQ